MAIFAAVYMVASFSYVLLLNLDTDAQEEIITASKEGLHAMKRAAGGTWSRTLIGEGAPGEVKLGRVGGRRMLATVEPWHGKSIVVYAERPGVWSRAVIESELTGGHALGWADSTATAATSSLPAGATRRNQAWQSTRSIVKARSNRRR